MRCVRNPDGSLGLLDAEDAALATVVPARVGDPAFDTMAERIALALSGAARVLVMYRDGLAEETRADLPCEVLLVEEDRFDEPPIRLRPRKVAGDVAGVDHALALVRRQLDAAGG